MSGRMTSSLTIALGDSAAMMPGSETPRKRPARLSCLACAIAAPFMGPFMAPAPQPVQMS
jgi:hypothetical protein